MNEFFNKTIKKLLIDEFNNMDKLQLEKLRDLLNDNKNRTKMRTPYKQYYNRD